MSWWPVVTVGDFNSRGCWFESWWMQANFSLYIAYRNSSAKRREYFGSHLFATKMPSTMAGIKKLKCFVQLALEPAHNGIWPKKLRKLKTVKKDFIHI